MTAATAFASAPASVTRPCACGKFLFAGSQKFYVRGVTYGTFRPDESGNEFQQAQAISDFKAMSACHVNALRAYTVPPRWFLDLANDYGFRVMVGIPWEQHVTFLQDMKRVTSIERRVRAAVRSCAGHPAVLCYAIGNEIPASIVRWHGRRRVQDFIRRLYQAAKEEDPCGLVTYINYPTTEYLELPFLDLVCFNVYLESQDRFQSYLGRLQNLAGERPVIIAEVGMDSRRHAEQEQALALDWQIRTAFCSGCAGVFVFSWTDEWHRGGCDIQDWHFGLTRQDRTHKSALGVVRSAFAEVPFTAAQTWPRISVVVCTYNGNRTILECLAGLSQLRYPNFEVILIDDGSTIPMADVAKEYNVRSIRTPNQGLSSARNAGMEAATGEIIAYIDDDAYPDPDWLSYLADGFLRTSHSAIGGPNTAPVGDGHIADCVANAPGGPVHVLLSDELAEHIPGCNMAFRKAALQAIGGFDPRFRTAGDDVDVCWRLQQRGWTIGFNPAAMVWHHRRNSLHAYWRQQVGYGRAEVLLAEKWPEKYNRAGHLSWAGRIYGKGLTLGFGQVERIYHGVWGSAPFQRLYRAGPSVPFSILLVPEWYLIVFVLAALAALSLDWRPLRMAVPLFALASIASLAQAWRSAARATFCPPLRSAGERIWMYALTAILFLAQPIARLCGRVGSDLFRLQRSRFGAMCIPRSKSFQLWSESWQTAETRLESLQSSLRAQGAIVLHGSDYDRWDLEVQGGRLGSCRLRMAIEEHGSGRQLIRLRSSPHFSPAWLACISVSAPIAAAATLDRAFGTLAFFAVVAGVAAYCAFEQVGVATTAVIEAVSRLGLPEIAQKSRQGAVQSESGSSAHAKGADASSRASDLLLYRRLLQQARPCWGYVAAIFLLDLLSSPLKLLAPLPLKIAVDSAIGGRPLPHFLARLLPASVLAPHAAALAAAVGLLVGFALVNQLQNLASSLLRTYTAEKLVLAFRARLFGHIQRLSVSYHDMSGTADSLYRIQYDAAAIQYVPIDGLIPFVTAVLTLFAMLWVTVHIDWQLAMVALAVSPILYVVSQTCRVRLRAQTRKVKKLESSAMSVVQETLSAMRVVKAFGREDHQRGRYVHDSAHGMRARVRLGLAEGVYSLSIGLITAVGTAAALWLGVLHVRSGLLTLGDLLLVVAYLGQLYEPLRTIGKKSSSLQGYLTSAERAFAILDRSPDVVERPSARPLVRALGGVGFRDVCFAYENGHPVLHNISFDVPAGVRVGIAGKTGAGKTTILSLLARFYDPDSGQILLDDVDLRDYRLSDLRNQFAIVLQEPVLFSTSIEENIAYARPSATEADIIRAAELADAHDFITRLPQGYKTRVGERGMRLSGGERQRVSLARAFLKDAPVLLLDEPTSSVDMKTESNIVEAIDRLMLGRTTFIVAHRLGTLGHCDLNLELEGGRLLRCPAPVNGLRARLS